MALGSVEQSRQLAHPITRTDEQVRALEDAVSINQQELFAPNQLSFADRLASLEARVDALEEKDFQWHVDRTEGMSY